MTKARIALCVGLLTILGQAGMVMAANPDSGPGCGLGKLAWSDYPNQKNIAPQVMMATTNGTFGSQTFGISSGTSGCTNDGQIMAEHKVNVFAASNYENLSQEMAQGQGEHLASLATLMGVPAEDQPAFFAMAQDRYTTMAQAGNPEPEAIVAALHQGLNQNSISAKSSLHR